MTLVQGNNMVDGIRTLGAVAGVTDAIIQLNSDLVSRCLDYIIEEWHITEDRYRQLEERASAFIKQAHNSAHAAWEARQATTSEDRS
jgi:uncharacterized protein YeeX (DUF496 family)